jgi:hypothetical protein
MAEISEDPTPITEEEHFLLSVQIHDRKTGATRRLEVRVRPPVYEGIVSLRISEETGLPEWQFEIFTVERKRHFRRELELQ